MSVPKPLIKEGTIPFSNLLLPPNTQAFTWYKTIGDFKTPHQTPLIILHGGPGLTHDYLLQMQDLYPKYGIPVIFYDQIGNGCSTHFRDRAGDEDFWVEELFWAELENLVVGLGIESYDILGHSWGGMMGATFAGRSPSPKGLRKLILANAPATVRDWLAAYNSFLEDMPEDVKSSIKKGEESGERSSKEYEAALEKFLAKHCVGSDPPPELAESFGWVGKDPTVATTMMGESEFICTGNMRYWSAVESCKLISVPTLVLNGTAEGADDVAIQPLLEGVRGVEYVKFKHSSHMPLYDEKEEYLRVVGEWLLK